MSVQKLGIRAVLQYGEKEDTRLVQVTSATINIGLREIPTAVVQVGVGRDTQTGTIEPSFGDSPEPDVPAKLYVRLDGVKPDGTGVFDPSKAMLLFDGFINSMAATRLAKQSAGSVTIRHWLSSLHSASLLASYAYPGSSAVLTLPAYQRFKEGAGSTAGSGPPHGLLQKQIVYVEPGQIKDDIWRTIAKPFLIRVSEQNPFGKVTRFASCFPEAGGDNVEALAALARIEGETETYGLEPDQWGVPLELSPTTPAAIINAIKSNLTAPRVKNLLQHSAWTYLVSQISAPFMCAVIPGIDRARVVPLSPSLNRVYKELGPNDLLRQDRNRPVEHPYRAVTMSAGNLSDAGSNMAGGQVREPFAFGPCFSPPKASKKGLVRQISPPAWLREAQFSAFDPAMTSRALDGVAGGLMGDQTADQANEADRSAAATAERLRSTVDQYGQDYVKAMYANDMIAARSVKLMTGLRMDISPGSQLKVNLNSDIPGFGNTLYGMVSRVSIIIDAGRPFAVSNFQLSHIRNEYENQTEVIGVEKHPLFEDQFLGAPISSDFA